MSKYKLILFLVVLMPLLPKVSVAQYFYINSAPAMVGDNKIYYLHTDTCGTFTDSTNLPIESCQSIKFYSDIAMDRDSTLWYLLDTVINNIRCHGLIKRKLSDTNCQFVLKFPYHGFNSLVADSLNNIYAVGMGGILFKYDGSSLSSIDTLPQHMIPAGDLFLYNNRMFLTCRSTGNDSLYLTELNLDNRGEPCYHMSLDGLDAWAAFALEKEGAPDRAFVITVNTSNNTSTLVEIDIDNKKILSPKCTYPFLAWGAAAYYPAVWDSTTCPPPSSINKQSLQAEYVTVLNPVNGKIRIKTNIKSSSLNLIDLYDISGRKVKNYSPKDFPENLDVYDLSGGLYMLRLSSKEGGIYSEKVLISGQY